MEATQVSTEVRIDKQNVVETYAPIWKNLEDAMLSETNQSQKTNTVWFHLHEISSKIGKTVQAESGLEVTRVELGAGEIENHWLKGTEFLLAVMKKKINSGDGCTT